jgi:hypothetical protein
MERQLSVGVALLFFLFVVVFVVIDLPGTTITLTDRYPAQRDTPPVERLVMWPKPPALISAPRSSPEEMWGILSKLLLLPAA